MSENIHQELLKLQNELTRLKDAVEQIDLAKDVSLNAVSSAENVILITSKLRKDYENLAISTNKLMEEIDSIDFPARLDKLDANIAGINAGVQNINSRVDSLERNLSDRINSGVKELDIKLNTIIKDQGKNFRLTKILIVIIIVLALGLYPLILLFSL